MHQVSERQVPEPIIEPGAAPEIAKLSQAPAQIEDGGQPTVDELEEINLGSSDDPRPTFLRMNIPPAERKEFIK